ncbi:VOC family protein [Phytoactinopolyspora alkaliphila]|uniref:VOC family protein n=1 Tax=Phytoactinopolyspora alkaliphila TaxID=1783498 RepID=A0A6N9YTJ7_9ACTN|nr:VOC family protein [Phytoactinopolyspora alkaliphila]NED98371.1 VOC family protein [Phytoactinopolyspora alkaliphila]
MARLRDVVFDCGNPAALARFWAAALDDYDVAPYDEEAMAYLKAQGIDDPEDDPSVLVEPRSGVGPRLWFNLVPEPKQAKNRLHIDITSDDFDAELRRLTGLGASTLREDEQGWTVMADPEGNEFCLMR